MAAATTGLVATSQAAVIYNESSGGDLANSSGAATVLSSGTNEVIGELHHIDDTNDHFIIGNLSPGGTANFSYSYEKTDWAIEVGFTFSDPAGGDLLATGFMLPLTGSGSTGNLTVPASGQIRVSVQNQYTSEGGGPTTTWSVSTADVVPEPSGAALIALGSLLALRRKRD